MFVELLGNSWLNLTEIWAVAIIQLVGPELQPEWVVRFYLKPSYEQSSVDSPPFDTKEEAADFAQRIMKQATLFRQIQ